MVFHGELGHNYLAIKDFLLSGKIPLLGPPTSHPWLFFGPIFYWIMFPIMAVFDFNPVAPACFFAIVGGLTIYLNYLLVKRISDEKTALISSFLISFSPAFLDATRGARFFSLIIPFFYVLFLQLFKKPKSYLLVGLTFGVMLNFHYTPIVLLPIIVYPIFKEKGRSNNIFKFILGTLIPLLPIIIYDFFHGFEMFTKFLVWIPYRIAGFAGLYPKNNTSIESLYFGLTSILKFLASLFVFGTHDLIIIFGTLIFLIIIVTARREKILAITLFIGFLGLILHGEPPSHYFYILYPIPIIIVSIFFSQIKSSKVVYVFLGSIFLLSCLNFKNWFNSFENLKNINIEYSEQLAASKSIIEDAKKRNFIIRRVGESDEFEENYSQNYKYLLWWMGGHVVNRSNLEYIFVEKHKAMFNVQIVYSGKELTVYKYEF